MSFVSQWNRIERELPSSWSDARLVVTIENDANCDRAAALLGPANPGRREKVLRLITSRSGGGVGPEAVRRLLARLDREEITGHVELVGTGETEPHDEIARATLADEWDAAAATLPDDWSDVYAELHLRSSDHVERAALLASPLNPARHGSTSTLRFRTSSRHGYGASAEMTRRCLARLDEEGIPGALNVVRVLCDTDHVSTQGPVWRLAGRSV